MELFLVENLKIILFGNINALYRGQVTVKISAFEVLVSKLNCSLNYQVTDSFSSHVFVNAYRIEVCNAVWKIEVLLMLLFKARFYFLDLFQDLLHSRIRRNLRILECQVIRYCFTLSTQRECSNKFARVAVINTESLVPLNFPISDNLISRSNSVFGDSVHDYQGVIHSVLSQEILQISDFFLLLWKSD